MAKIRGTKISRPIPFEKPDVRKDRGAYKPPKPTKPPKVKPPPPPPSKKEE